MEPEPELPSPREPEALLIAVDSYTIETSGNTFSGLRDAAMRLARTRLIYSTLKDDLLSVVKSGSAVTSNKLATENPEGYVGIEILQPPASKSLNAVRVLFDLTPGIQASNLLDLLDVCGDTLSEPAADRAKQKRLVLFTDAVGICGSMTPEYADDFTASCELYKEHGIRVDVVCACEESEAEEIQAVDEELTEMGSFSVDNALKLTEGSRFKFLLVLCKASGGVIMSLKEALPLVVKPRPRMKRAVAKFRGTLNIADIIHIPVKRFSYVNEAKPPTARKVSWEATVKRREPIPVLVETQLVASAKDEAPLEAEEVVNAYPYGPELVPEHNEVDTYAWSIHLKQGLDALGFVAQDSVPQRLFMGRVDVVLAMPSVSGADQLMKSLVLAMQAEDLGILARSVAPKSGGAPHLAFLWPRVETDRKTGAMRNFFLFVVDLPMREDIRNLPFASLDDTHNEIPRSACKVMEQYIDASMLERTGEFGTVKAGLEEEEEEDYIQAVWPPNINNPNMDWFHICVIHRALVGISGTDFPRLSEWHEKVIDPLSFVRDVSKMSVSQSVRELKTALPVILAPRMVKKSKRVHEALNGDMASIVDYLPPETVDGEESNNEEDEFVDPYESSRKNSDERLSAMSDCVLVDVGTETPVVDFENLVKKDFGFAAESLLVVVRRLIRDLVDDDKAMACLISLRRLSAEKKEIGFFNDFLVTSVARCDRDDMLGNRTAAFFRHVHRRNKVESALKVLPLPASNRTGSERPGAYRELLEDVSRQVVAIASHGSQELSNSNLTKDHTEQYPYKVS